jgi:TonB family protein
MAPLRPSNPSPLLAPGPRVAVRTRSVLSGEIVQQAGIDVILTRLRQDIAAGTQETDTILNTIAGAIRSLTGATGAAIAMPHDGAVVCVGRSGETAPELGTRLNVDSGISGECLRTGTILRCDDASRDFHVDAEVCRQLGLQSIAVVPLRGQQGRVGVLEAFSTQSYAFNDDDMDILGRLAGLAEAAWARGSSTEVPSKAETADEEPFHFTVRKSAPPTVASVALARIAEALAGAHNELQTDRKWRYGTIGGLLVLVLFLLSFLGWRVWYKASIASKSIQHPTPQATPAERPDVAAGVGLTWKPGAERSVSRHNAAPAAHASKSTADIRRSNFVIRRPSTRNNVNTDTSGSIPSADDVPRIAAFSTGSPDFGSALSIAPAMPRFKAPISQGLAGGNLRHRVQPIYPPEARRVRLEGNVVLEATVTVQGQVEDLKLISGNPLLAQAAMDAVRKWRYSPYLLNGKPIPKQTRITIIFTAQQ